VEVFRVRKRLGMDDKLSGSIPSKTNVNMEYDIARECQVRISKSRNMPSKFNRD